MSKHKTGGGKPGNHKGQPIGKAKPGDKPGLAVREPTAGEDADAAAGMGKAKLADPDTRPAAQPTTPAHKGPAAPEAKKAAEKSRTGTVYAVRDGNLYLQSKKPGGDEPTGEEGECCKLAEGCKVKVNGKETTADDLKRGDVVTLTGDDVHEIDAARS